MFRRRRPAVVSSGLPQEKAAVAEPGLGLRSSEVDRLRARTAAKFVLRIEATGRCPTCGAPFPQPLLLALDEGYWGDGGRVVGLQVLALRCARCAEES